MKKIIALAAIAAACSTSAFAQSVGQFYGEAMYDSFSIKDTSSENIGTVKLNGVRFNVGQVVVDNLAVEGTLMVGGGSGTFSDDSEISTKIKSGYGIALRPFINITPDVELFGRVGKNRAKTEWKAGSEGGSDTVTNTIYGIGLAYKASNDVRVVFDYSKQPDKNDGKVTTMGVGVRYNF